MNQNLFRPENIIPALLTPLLSLNLAGMAAGAAWLGALSQWQVIWLGGLMLFFSPFIVPVLMMPAGIFSHFMALYSNNGRKDRERLMLVLSIAYILLFLTLWCVGIFEYITARVQPDARWAALLWANTAALAPLLIWSSRDRKNIFIMTLVETAQAALLILSAITVFGLDTPFWLSCGILGVILAVVPAVQAFNEAKKPR